MTRKRQGTTNRAAEDGRRTRWREHRTTRRTELVDAAIRAVHAHGAGVGMDEIAAEAGTSKTVLYRYFDDKADLHDAVGRRVAEDVVAAIAVALDRTLHPREHVAAVIDTYLRVLEEEPELYRFVVRRRFAESSGNDPVSEYSGQVAAQLARTMGGALRLGGLDSGGAEPWGHGIVGLVQAAGDWWLDRQPMSRASLTGYLTTLIWGGFAGLYAAAGVDPDAQQPLRLVAPTESGQTRSAIEETGR